MVIFLRVAIAKPGLDVRLMLARSWRTAVMRDRADMRWLGFAIMAACGGGGGFDARDTEPAVLPGSFSVAWALRSANGQSETCAQVNATLVVVGIHDERSDERASVSFSCGLASGFSGALTPSTYDFSFTLSGATTMIAAGAAQNGIAIAADTTTRLASVTFVVP
jgi:hypothetical protein